MTDEENIFCDFCGEFTTKYIAFKSKATALFGFLKGEKKTVICFDCLSKHLEEIGLMVIET